MTSTMRAWIVPQIDSRRQPGEPAWRVRAARRTGLSWRNGRQSRPTRGIRMTQRIQGIADAAAHGAVKELFDSSNQLLGRTANLMRILAHSPQLAKWMLPFIAAVRQPNAGAVSDVRLRNLAVLKTSTLNGCRY